MRYLRMIILVIATVMALGAAAQENKYVKVQEMYLYGVGYALDDSVAYVTAVMPVKDAWKQKKTGFLYARNEYSRQYAEHLKNKDVVQPFTAISYANTRAKAEKKFLKMTNKLVKAGYVLKHISASDFSFSVVGYEAPEENDVKPAKQADVSAKKKAKKK